MSFVRLTREQSKKRIEDLVKKFDKNKKQYLDNSYDETNVRVEFIDKFFEALGWDVYNEKGAFNDKKEVLREEDLKMNNATKHPDYAFNDRGQVLFYVEAKKPSVDIKDDKAPAYQLRRYGWNKKLAISILTDFEEFAVYDVSKQPKAKDKAAAGRIKFLTYDKYIENFDYLYDTFSWEAVYDKGTFDDYIATFKIKGTEEIDNKLLDTITEWRQNLAKRISLDNGLNAKELNIAVQKIIDRVLFLRIAEDKQIEQYGSLQSILSNIDIYKRLVEKFDIADKKYNSGLFKKEKWVDELNIDDKILNDIIISMYPDGDCPYEWSILPIEILGNIYEKFLGSEIILKNVANGKTTAIIEEKPEVKKAGGVYYTPKYIVDYIVKETVGKKLNDILMLKTNNTIEKIVKEADKLKILDMACGSGSFLIGAYKYLLDWYFNQYVKEENKYLKKKLLVKTNNGVQLSIEEKKRILTNNIYGVDIDYQAVEVTKLSLFLQMLDKQGKLLDEIGTENMFMLTEGEILPDLSNNIKCGNSVVGTDDLLKYVNYNDMTADEKIKINPFNWKSEFADIINKGGFDCIVGNPPYIKEYTDKSIFEPLHNNECYMGKMDFWYFFGNQSIKLINDKGLISFIATNNWNTSSGAQKFRNIILDKAQIYKYIDFSEYKVFGSASIQTMIYTMGKSDGKEKFYFDYYKISDNKSMNEVKQLLVNQDNAIIKKRINIDRNELKDKVISFNDSSDEALLNKIKKYGDIYLGKNEVGQGIVPALDDYFIVKSLNKFNSKEKKYIKHWETGLLDRYSKYQNEIYLIYLSDKNFKNENIKDYINIYNHFEPYKKELKEAKIKYGTPNKPYYYVHRERDERFFVGGNEKIVAQVRCKRPRFYYTVEEFYGSRALNFIQTNRVDMKYLVALLNSNLIYYWLKNNGKIQGDIIKLEGDSLFNIPIAIPSDKDVEELHKLVDVITNNKKIKSDVLIKENIVIDNKINNIIYSIYSINESEKEYIEDYLSKLDW